MKKIITIIFLFAFTFINSQTGVNKPGWLLNGNTGLTGNFIGTTNNFDLIFKYNNVERFRIGSSGSIFSSAVNFGSNDVTIGANQIFNFGTEGYITTNSGNGTIEMTSGDPSTVYSQVLASPTQFINLASADGGNTSSFLALYGAGISVPNNGTNNAFVIDESVSSKGAVYAQDYSANFTNESLISKRYALATFAPTVTGGYLPYIGGTSNVNIGTHTLHIGPASTNTTALGITRISQGTSWADFGERSAGIFGFWFGQTTPTTANYGLIGTSSVTRLNGNAVSLQVATVDILACNSGGAVITGSASVPLLTSPAASNLGLNAPSGQSVDLRINNGNVAQFFTTSSFISNNVRIGSFVAPTVALDVTGSAQISGNLVAPTIIATSGLQGNSLIPATTTDLLLTTRAGGTSDIVFRCTGTTPTETARFKTTGNLLINTTTDVPSAKVVIESTTQGFLPPRMTATQGSAISSPAEGLMIYVTNTNGTFTAKGWWGYDGAAWQKLNN